MPVVFYHFIHVAGLLGLSGLGVGLVLSNNKKPFQIAFGIISLLVFIAGFGLMAKLGYSFKENTWISAKLLLFLSLTAGLPILVKRTAMPQGALLGFLSIIFTLGVLLVYIRPF